MAMISEEEAYIKLYFHKLETGIEKLFKQATTAKNLMFKTATDDNLVFPDSIQETDQITEGTGPVKYEDGKLAQGDFIMPDGTKFTLDSKGYVIKITAPTSDRVKEKQPRRPFKVRGLK